MLLGAWCLVLAIRCHDVRFISRLQGHCDTDVTLLNECGGHANPFHYHQRMTCLHTNDAGTGHSTSVGTMLDGKMLYGKWEDFNAVPPLAAYDLVDACNGHFGTNPNSPATEVYHYHVTDLAPFTVGCFGPAVDAGTDEELMVTIAMCRDFHAELCGSALSRRPAPRAPAPSLTQHTCSVPDPRTSPDPRTPALTHRPSLASTLFRRQMAMLSTSRPGTARRW